MNINDFIKQKEDGSYEVDQAAFNAALDRERNQASETSKKNTEQKLRSEIEKELKTKLEEEAKMTAEEKLKKDMEAFAQQKRDFDKQRITTIYKDAGITDTEIEYLTTLIGDDSEKNLETATKFADARKKANQEYEKVLIEKFQTNGYRPKDDGNGNTEDIGAQFAKEFAAKTNISDFVDLSGKTGDGIKLN